MTLLAIRAVRDQMYIGIRESYVRRMMEQALAAAGLQDIFALVLFGGDGDQLHILFVELIFYISQKMRLCLTEAAQTVL